MKSYSEVSNGMSFINLDKTILRYDVTGIATVVAKFDTFLDDKSFKPSSRQPRISQYGEQIQVGSIVLAEEKQSELVEGEKKERATDEPRKIVPFKIHAINNQVKNSSFTLKVIAFQCKSE